MVQMMVTNGEPAIYGTPSNPLAAGSTWDQCLEYCYNLGTCIVVYDNNCQMFEIGEISTATKKEGSVIAFKVLAADTCPVEDTGSFQGYYATNSTYRPYNVTFSSPTWTFQAGPLVTCPTNFNLFVRDKGPWCMQVVQHYACCNRTVASIMCRQFYGDSQLSGVENQAEYDFIAAKSIPIYQNVSSGLTVGLSFTYTGIWVDGNRTAACTNTMVSPCDTIQAFRFSDPTLSSNPQGYIWLPGKPDGSPAPADSIILRVNGMTNYGMDDINQTFPTDGVGNGCWKGYVCGIQPS